MKKHYSFHLVLAGLLVSCAASAFEVEFNKDQWCTNGVEAGGYDATGNTPIGWTATSDFKNSFILSDRNGQDGVPALKFNPYGESKTKSGELRMGTSVCVPREEIVCDNIAATLMLYLRPLQNKSVDKVQLIATTNDWDETISIGDAIPIRDDQYEMGWKTNNITGKFTGLSQIGTDAAFRIGVKVSPGGNSMTYAFLHSMSVRFIACATPDRPVLVSAEEDPPNYSAPLDSAIAPGVEHGRIAVKVNVSPAEKISDLKVWGVLTRRNGVRTSAVTNELMEVDGIYYEKLQDARARTCFDSGESISVSVFTQYKSNNPAVSALGEIGTDGSAYEFSESVDYSVNKLGSVWINELGQDGAGHCCVELCGTTNRTYLSGWQVVLSGMDREGELRAYTNSFAEAFDFSTNMVNGVVGIETYRWEALDSVEIKGATLELKNAVGVVEFSALDIALPSHYQMTGKAKWHGKDNDDWSYDWSGTATDGTFTFSQSSEGVSFGRVNKGQGFLVPVGSMLNFTTLIGGNGETHNPLPYASVSATVDGILNGCDGVTNFVEQTDLDGTAHIKIEGYSDDASNVSLMISVSAFAWKCEDVSTNISLYGRSVSLTNFVSSGLAYDDFSELRDYWKNESDIRNGQNKTQYWEIVESAAQVDTRTGYKGSASLTTSSYMALRGKKWLDISFDFKNDRNFGVLTDCAKLTIILADTADFSGNTLETITVANKSASYETGEWYSVREFLRVPADFATDGRVWIRVYATKTTGSTSAYTTMDELRIAALDAVKVNELKMDEPTTGKSFPRDLPSDVELDLTPLTGGVVSNFNEKVLGYDVTTNDVPAGTYGSVAEYEEFLATLENDVVVSTVTNVERTLVDVTTNFVRDVAADLVMTINGNEFVIPFEFADGSLTNHILATENNVQLKIPASKVTEMTGGFLPGAKVEYYARVTYDPDDASDSGERDVRYFPDNSTPTDTGWYAKGGYLPVARSFDVPGPALSIYGTPEITEDRISVNYIAWETNGIASLDFILSTNGVPVQSESLETNDVERVARTFVATNLVANTEYVLSMAGAAQNGGTLTPTNYSFVTLPVLTSAAIAGTSTSAAQLTVSGNAAGYVVNPNSWKQSGDTTWTRTGCSPNSLVMATVYATNKVGAASVATNTPSGYTYAAAATRSPSIEKDVVTVSVGADKDYDAADDGNPLETEYAVLVTTNDVVSAYVSTNGVPVWKTLGEWQNDWVTVGTPTLELTATNAFRFVTRNFDKTHESFNDSPETATNCTFVMTAEITGVEQKADPFGTVDIALRFFDPAMSQDAVATVQYKLDGETEWTDVASVNVSFDAIETVQHVSWNALSVVGRNAPKAYTLRVMITDGKRPSAWMEMAQPAQVDFVQPTVSLVRTTPEYIKAGTMGLTATFSKPVTGFDANSLKVENVKNVSVTGSGKDYTITVTPNADGVVSVQVLADKVADALGNKNTASMEQTCKYDTKKPVFEPKDHPIDGYPEEGVVTNGADFAFKVFADDKSPVTYYWFTNGVLAAGENSDEFASTVLEGTNTVSVYAEDRAGNACDPVSRKWVVDQTQPTDPVIDGKPAELTNVPNFTMTARSTDKWTAVEYHWTLRRGEDTASTGEGATFSRSGLEDGTYTVSVYATDEAGNKSATVSWTWTLDTTKPVVQSFDGYPAEGVVTNGTDFAFTVDVTDTTDLTYYWFTNGVLVADEKSRAFAGTAVEGTNTVSVYAEDKAGNVCDPVSRKWVVDTIEPTEPVIDGKPAELTNVPGFTMTARSTDDTAIEYHWTLRRGEDTASTGEGATFSRGGLEDGAYAVSVYATDEANNVSATNTWKWTLDTTAPKVALSSETPDPFNSNDKFVVTVAFDEPVVGFTKDSVTVNGGDPVDVTESPDVANAYLVEITPSKDGEIFVSVAPGAVKDLAGNGNEASTNEDGEKAPLTRNCDTSRPTVTLKSDTPAAFNAAKAPMVVTVTFSEPVTNFTEAAVLIENGNGTVRPLVGSTTPETTYTVTIDPVADGEIPVKIKENAVTDLAGNGNKASEETLTRTYDTKAPAAPTITGTPTPGALTNVKDVDLAAESAGEKSCIYHWTLKRGEETVSTGDGATLKRGDLADGSYTAHVTAEDAAGNVSAESVRSWMLDTQKPTVSEFSSQTPDRFNAATPFVVTVTFSEPVTNFTDKAVVTKNAKSIAIAGSGMNYTMTVTPDKDGEVSVQIGANTVGDLAGNGNEASAELKRTYDNTKPTVTLASDAPTYFNTNPLVVTVTFSEPVTNFTTSTVKVGNGTVSGYSGSGKDYTVNIAPLGDGEVTAWIEADSVGDLAGNGNEASETLKRTYDKTRPTVRLESDATARFNEAASPILVTATFSEPVTNFTVASVKVVNGKASEVGGKGTVYTFKVTPDGEGSVTVQIPQDKVADAAGNGNEASEPLSRVYDKTAPTVTLSCGASGRFRESPLVVTAVFSEPVTNFLKEGTVVIGNGDVTDVVKVEGVENTYQVTIEPKTAGDVTVLVPAGAVADLAGNGNVASDTLTCVFDNVRPTVTLTSETPQYFNKEKAPLVVTATFSEPVTNFLKEGVIFVDNGTVKSVTLVDAMSPSRPDEPQAYTIVIDPTENGDVIVQVKAGVVADEAGNQNEDSNELTRTYDTEGPTVALSCDEALRSKELLNTNDMPVVVTVTFSEAVTNFTKEAVTVTDGVVEGDVEKVEGSDCVYTVKITATRNSENFGVRIAADAVTDKAGNGNSESNELKWRCDITRPTVTLKSNSGTAIQSGSISVQITFSEEVVGFAKTSLKVTNGEISGDVKGLGPVYTVDVTPIAEGPVAVWIEAGEVSDAAGNGNGASNLLTVIYDKTKPDEPSITGSLDGKMMTLTATTHDASAILDYRWTVNNKLTVHTVNDAVYTDSLTVESVEGENTVTLMVRDIAKNTRSSVFSWTYTKPTSSDVDFGGGITVKVDPDTGKTNSVSFTALDFRPGEASTFTLSGFEATNPDLSGFKMWFVVSDVLGGATRHVATEKPSFDPAKSELTVELPATATEAKDSFFILGIDNKE